MSIALAVAVSAVALGGARAGTLPVLSAGALPALATTTHAVTAHDLAADVAGGARFERLLLAWGFSRGRERDFQGESRRIDRAVSRTLIFAHAAGARAYVRYLGAHAAALYGAGSGTVALTSRGRTGYLLEAAPCACHRASPTLLAVVARGPRVTWLELNGGAVKPAVVRALLARAP
jgi:hypothetical protein